MSRDAWEGSTNGYGYVSSNPINLIDPLGWYGCNPVTGKCEDGRYLCVIQGNYQGSYDVNGQPCIVNPNNVQTGNAPTPVLIRPVTTLDDMPAYWWYTSPVARPPKRVRLDRSSSTPIPPNGCNYCSDPKKLPYTRYQYNALVQVIAGGSLYIDEVIIFNHNLPQVDTRVKNNTLATGFSLASITLDAVEVGTAATIPAGLPDFVAFTDAGAALGGSITSGETYIFATPHECLPQMLVIGQDVLVNGADFIIGSGAKYALTGAGGAGGGIPGAVGGFITGAGIDMTTSTASLAHDFTKGTGMMGSHISVGFYIDKDNYPHQLKTVLLLGGFE